MKESYKNPALPEIHAAFSKVLPILQELANPDFNYGGCLNDDLWYTWSQDLERVSEPVWALHALFVWKDWPNQIEWLRNLDLDTADIHSLGKYLFAIHRQDRFVEGLLFCCYKDGTILRILNRMKLELDKDRSNAPGTYFRKSNTAP